MRMLNDGGLISVYNTEGGLVRTALSPFAIATEYNIDYVKDFYGNKVFSEPTKEEMTNLLPALKKADEIALKIISELGITKNVDWKIAKINKDKIDQNQN